VTRFQAAVLKELNSPLVVEELELKSPLLGGQVLVRMISSSICGSQLLEIQGFKNNARFLPHMLGHEGFGQVEDIGPGTTRIKVGDFVVAHWRKTSGLEGPGVKFSSKSGVDVGAGPVTTFSEYSVISENRLTPVPGKTDPKLGSLLGCALSTGFSTVEKLLGAAFGSTVLVFGSGGVGISSVVACSLRGFGQIIVVDLGEQKRAYALANGATGYVDALSEKWKNQVLALNEGNKFNAVIEASGSKDALLAAGEFSQDGGKVIILGQGAPDKSIELGPQSSAFGATEGKSFVFSHGGSFDPASDIQRYIYAIGEKGASVSGALSNTSDDLENVNELIARMKDGEPGRFFLEF
jgi:Zn-dependent alcohol dehydrogenase